LSVSLGHHGNVLHDDVLSALDKVVKAAQAAKLPIFMPVFSADVSEGRRQVDVWRGRGVRHFMVGSDKILIKDQFRRYRASMGV
jgi:2-keto-3-deoxy-L-rhamnonate aldolase RhmA